MAEIKNSFLRSKMNKDLDDRLIPNGEYRDAQNISVGKSEDDDIGSLETVLGNVLISVTNIVKAPNLKIIGYLTDEYTDTVFVFATDYTDGANYNSAPVRPTSSSTCIIYSWTAKDPNNISTLIDNEFLNFSTTNPVQATLIENLLFFTDNRNQPRKINTTRTLGYYTSEDQISVAKYNPYLPISLIKKETGIVNAITSSTVFTLNVANPKITVGMSVVSANKTGTQKIQGDEFITVTNVNGAIITLSSGPTSAANNPAVDDNFIFLTSTMTNKSSEANWPGDPDYLEDKFVRFSYRFKYDDGEYSIIAPFTQIAFIPKQKGYYLNGDEDAAYRSTILQWMENNVDNVELLIPLPDKANLLNSSYKITSMDVLYKESDALVVKVLETLTITEVIESSSDNVCTYSYQSRKPYKTLTQAQTIRVYDKVPVRALAQETSANRVIYGNFHDVYTPPSNVDYTVNTLEKNTFSSDSWIEYPNHSLKQNRNYQVGFVLSDKFGRQSPVLLSPVTTNNTVANALGSTIFSPYYSATDNLNVRDWFGDTLQVVVNSEIQSNNSGNSQPNFSTGEPGLYAIRTGTGKGFEINPGIGSEATIVNNVYTFALDPAAGINNVIPAEGDFLRGEYLDYVEVITVTLAAPFYTVTTGLNGIANVNAQINSSYLNNFQNDPDIKYAYSINPTGWYSYKVVVKQTEQDYYNVYLPGILKGYPDQTGVTTPVPFPNDPLGSTSNIVLINDNINKVPRDLAEVGPDQKQFRSSVQLFGRVQNTIVGTAAGASLNNIQYYPGTSTDTAISIATTNDSNMEFANLSTEGQANIYQIDSKPLIARLATSNSIGVVSSVTANINMQPFLAIYETEPVDSLLDIYWETTTVGMLSDLNEDISTGYEGPTSLAFDFSSFNEGVAPGAAITDLVWPTSNEGAVFNNTNPTTATSFSVIDSNENDVTDEFLLYQETAVGADQYKYQIKTGAISNSKPSDAFFTYKNDSLVTGNYTFSIEITPTLTPADANTISIQGAFSNLDPSFSPALALITKTVDEANIGTLSAINGTNVSNILSEQKSQLQWSITAGNPTGINGQPAFAIEASTGVLTQTVNNTPNGLYDLTITLEDSVLSSVQGAGGETITGQQLVRIGPTPVNDGVVLTCVPGITDASAMFPTNGTIAPWNWSSTSQTLTAVWFLSDTVTSGAARTTYLKGTGWPTVPPSGTNGVFAGSGSGSTAVVGCNTIHKLGSALTQGTVALSLNMQLNLVGGGTPPNIEGEIESWRIYHRTGNTQAWVSIADINNHTIPAAGIQRSSGNGPRIQTLSTTGAYYLQYVMAYNTPGEYLVVAVNSQSTTSDSQTQALLTWVNSDDLNYGTCVIENGSNTTSGVATTYEYGISTSTGSYGCSFGLTSIYSNVAYGQYIGQFFTTNTLSTPYPFTTDATDGNGVTHTNFYSYKMKVGPYREASNDHKYSFSTRFTTGAGNLAKIYNPPNWTTNCYVQNCGNMAAASNQVTQGCNPLALTYPYTMDTTTVG